MGYHYSQLTYAEQTNTDKGYPEYYSEITKKHTGEFNDQKVKEVLSDYIDRYQSEGVEQRPLDVFSWSIAETFFPKGEDIYLKMNDAMDNGEKITLDQIKVQTLQDVGFASLNTPLKLGGYNTWGDLFKVTNYLFLLASLLIIFICSSVFAGETASNINQLLFSTVNGRGKLTVIKIISATGVSILIFFIIQLISFAFFYFYYGISGWDASIQTNFSMILYSFPVEMNNLQVYFLVIGVQMVGLVSIVGITLLISSMVKSPFVSLAVSLGVFFLPYLLGQVFQTGIVAKILNLFPIQHYQVEEMLTIMQTDTVFFFSTFIWNVILTICIGIVIKIIAYLTICFKIKHMQVR